MNADFPAPNRFVQSGRRRGYMLGVLGLAAGFWVWAALAVFMPVAPSQQVGIETPLADQLELARLYHADTQQALSDSQAELAIAGERFDAVQAQQSELADRSLAAEEALRKMIANPARMGIEAAVSTLVAERQNLLERLTPEHPAVLEIDARLAATQAQLEATPELVPAPADTLARDNAELALEQSQMAAQFSSADQALRLARQSCENAATAEQTAARQEAEIASALSRASSETQVVARSVPARGWQFGCVFGLAVVAGGGTLAWAGGALRAVFTSSDEIAHTLGIPVLGVVPSGTSSSSAGQRLARLTLRVSVLFAEASLALAAFLLFSLVVKDPSAASDLASHPLDTLAAAFAQWKV